jgi:hypothetical protein
MVDRAVRSIPVPHRLPRLNDVAEIVPGMSVKDSASSDDPEVPFDVRSTLGFGHTLRLAVYEGVQSPKKLWAGVLMVDQQGVITFKDVGSARVGGRTPLEARMMIASVFRSAGRAAAHLNVQIISIENTPVLAVDGDVRQPSVLLCFKDMTIRDVLQQAGGRVSKTMARAVYVTRNGQRSFFSNEANAQMKLLPGDVVTFSPDL